MDNQLIHQIIDEIEKYDTIALYRHVFPDPDSYGAQVAVKEIIQETFPGKVVYLCGEHSERLAYIGVMDKAEDMTIDENTLGMILDVGDDYRVDDQSFKKCGKVIKIDHHKPFNEPFEDISWVDIEYPATCMMLVDLLIAAGDRLKTTKKAREALYVGIVADTGRFAYLDNPTEVFEKIVHITYDLDAKPLYDALYCRKISEVKFLGYIYSNFEARANGVGVLKIPKEVVAEFGLQPMAAARMVNALKDTEGLINWHFFAECAESGRIMCEFRSNGPCVNEIAAKYGGGGHILAAGATVENWDIVESMIKDFEENCK